MININYWTYNVNHILVSYLCNYGIFHYTGLLMSGPESGPEPPWPSGSGKFDNDTWFGVGLKHWTECTGCSINIKEYQSIISIGYCVQLDSNWSYSHVNWLSKRVCQDWGVNVLMVDSAEKNENWRCKFLDHSYSSFQQHAWRLQDKRTHQQLLYMIHAAWSKQWWNDMYLQEEYCNEKI